MRTEVVRIDPQIGWADATRRAAEVLSGGGLVAFPTETVYGLGACPTSPQAIERLRTVKSRAADKGFTVHLGSPEGAADFVSDLSGLAGRLIRKAWPGPLTLIIPVEHPAQAPVAQRLNGQALDAIYYQNNVGLRCPEDPVARELLQAVGSPVVAASANPAEHRPPQTGDDVLEKLDGQIDLLIDGGRTRYAKPSTIVRVVGASYELVREGVYDARVVDRFSTWRVLFVCTGNTCRSPMAAGLATKVLADRMGCGVLELASHHLEVSSAGTAGGFGGASENAVKVMAERGIDISDHVSAALSPEQVRKADLVLAMTGAHREIITGMVSSATDRIALLLGNEDVRDPIGGSVADYEVCADRIEEGVRARLRKVMI